MSPSLSTAILRATDPPPTLCDVGLARPVVSAERPSAIFDAIGWYPIGIAVPGGISTIAGTIVIGVTPIRVGQACTHCRCTYAQTISGPIAPTPARADRSPGPARSDPSDRMRRACPDIPNTITS